MELRFKQESNKLGVPSSNSIMFGASVMKRLRTTASLTNKNHLLMLASFLWRFNLILRLLGSRKQPFPVVNNPSFIALFYNYLAT